ncbi:hypothetical protein [Bartonella harrusi]|uniref:Conjugal transfer protein TrbH n=1 Tax=Bartonella harrusi TaxID=2961895 RepID=A0ABY5EU62_9HYPH|nr:hypothetical protein [Bartonella harrusi]UTO27671.1 hypothetical protein NMK50_00020 [Bartonella harrusi]
MLKYLLFLPLMLIVGCASLSQKAPLFSNYIDQNITENDAKFIAGDFVRYLRDPLPPAATTLIVKTSDTEDKFTPLLIDLLQRNGYGVIYTDQPEKSQNTGINLTYKVMPMYKGLVFVAQYGSSEITRYYVRLTTGNIVPSAPFSVRIDDGGNG